MKVTLLMALTADGKIGRDAAHFPDWTGTADKKLFARMSRAAGVVIMGSKTYDTLDGPLPDRKNVVLTRTPGRRDSSDAVLFTDAPPGEILDRLAAEGYEEAILAGGASINTLFAAAGRIDEIVVTVAPKIFGAGLSLFTEALEIDLDLMEVRRIGDDLACLHYRVRKME